MNLETCSQMLKVNKYADSEMALKKLCYEYLMLLLQIR